MQKILNKLFLDQAIKIIDMLRDNEMNFTLIKDFESQNRIKYIDIIYYHIQGLIENGELGIK